MSKFVLSFACLALLSVTLAVPRVGFGPGFQDWGYIDVRPGAHVFYWFYYTTANVARYQDRPLVIWLQGGPGGSGTGYGNFEELGPLDIFQQPRNLTWVRNYNVLFIDNPVGSGWSFVDSSSLLTRNNREIANDLVSFIRQFLNLNPEFRTSPIHIFGQSYGGKMGAEFAYVLDQEIKAGQISAVLSSTNFGNAWIHPLDLQESWAPVLYNYGYVDIDGYNRIDASTQRTKAACNSGQWTQCTNLWSTTEYVVWDETDGVDFYDIIAPIPKSAKDEVTAKFKSGYYNKNMIELTQLSWGGDADIDRGKVLNDLMNGPVRQALGMNRTWYSSSNAVFNAQSEDFMKPVTDTVAKLLDETSVKVGVYSGQLDLICATAGTTEWLNKLPWSGLNGYKNTAVRTSVAIDGYIEAYKRYYRNLHTFWVNRAGHSSPRDNAKALNYFLKEIAGY